MVVTPRIRTLVFAVLLVAAVAMVALAGGAAHASGDHAAAEERFAERINAERAERGQQALTVDTELTRVARGWTGEMTDAGELSHNPHRSDQVRASWRRLAENVGRSQAVGESEAELVDRLHRAFMNSEGHRANILMGEANRVGVGVEVTGDGMMYVTVLFMAADGAQDQAPIDEGGRMARQLYDGDADHVVLARSEVFADALGGTALAGADGPVLFTPGPRSHDPDPVLHPRTREQLDAALGGSGRVYLLGGASAVSPAVGRELDGAGYDVRRLAGATRVETAVAVAEEIARTRGPVDEVVVVRADEWPDAVSGGAYAAHAGAPVLVTGHGALHGAVAGFLDRHAPSTRWALGGTAALADATVAAAGADRVAGSERTATAVEVARQMWGRTAATDGDRFSSAPAHGGSAWASALALAPWSATHAAPQLLVGDAVPGSVRSYLDALGYHSSAHGDVFAAAAVPGAVLDELRSLLLG